MNTVNAVVVAAQDQEIQPFLDLLAGDLADDKDTSDLYSSVTRMVDLATPVGRAWIAHTAHHGRILVMRTGIGLVATAAALGWILAEYRTKCVVSIGSAGGLAADTAVLELVAGDSYAYGSADATVFGYKRGQVPGKPATFPGDADLLDCVDSRVRKGQVLSGDSFVTQANVGDMREAFPSALATDMESTAAAQTCMTWGVPFISLRCISDLCGPAANVDYHVALEDAALASAKAAAAMLSTFFSRQSHGRSPLFGRPAIDGALLLVLARAYDLPVATDASRIPDEIATAVRQQLTPHPAFVDEAIGLVASAVDTIKRKPNITLTAKKYDTERAKLVSSLGVSSERGHIAWPPTSQTVSKRSNGYWNDALKNLGIQVKSGRQRGTVKFSTEDYLHAMEEFSSWAANSGMTPSVAAYGLWLKQVSGSGAHPSSAAIRQHFGTWRNALNSIHEHPDGGITEGRM